MGYGLGASLGAKVGRPEKTVVNIAGDGCFRMNMNEIATAARHNIPLIQVVINNHVLGMVRQWQQLFHDRRYSFTPMDNPDFTMIASAYGIPADRVSDPAELPGAMRKLADAPGPYFLEVVVRPEENVFPMVPAGASLSDIICTD